MAADYNQYGIVGRVVRDVALEKRGGLDAATVCIATNHSWKDRATNESKESTSYFYFDMLGEMARSLVPYLKKGKRVVTSGYLVTESYETEDGRRRSVIALKPLHVQLLDGGTQGGHGGTGQ